MRGGQTDGGRPSSAVPPLLTHTHTHTNTHAASRLCMFCRLCARSFGRSSLFSLSRSLSCRASCSQMIFLVPSLLFSAWRSLNVLCIWSLNASIRISLRLNTEKTFSTVHLPLLKSFPSVSVLQPVRVCQLARNNVQFSNSEGKRRRRNHLVHQPFDCCAAAGSQVLALRSLISPNVQFSMDFMGFIPNQLPMLIAGGGEVEF